jgi:hypothetical protein
MDGYPFGSQFALTPAIRHPRVPAYVRRLRIIDLHGCGRPKFLLEGIEFAEAGNGRIESRVFDRSSYWATNPERIPVAILMG